jgi:hypothetical protein
MPHTPRTVRPAFWLGLPVLVAVIVGAIVASPRNSSSGIDSCGSGASCGAPASSAYVDHTTPEAALARGQAEGRGMVSQGWSTSAITNACQAGARLYRTNQVAYTSFMQGCVG